MKRKSPINIAINLYIGSKQVKELARCKLPSCAIFIIEIAGDGIAGGIRTETGTKYAYGVFANMDKGNSSEYTDFALPIIGAASWAECYNKFRS